MAMATTMFTEGENPILRVCRLGDLSILEKLLSSYREPVYCCGHSSQSVWDYDTDSEDEEEEEEEEEEDDDDGDEDEDEDGDDDNSEDSVWSYNARGSRGTVIYVKPRNNDNDNDNINENDKQLRRVDSSIQGLRSPYYSSSFHQQLQQQQRHTPTAITTTTTTTNQTYKSVTIAETAPQQPPPTTASTTTSTTQPSPTSTTATMATTAITSGTSVITQPCNCGPALPPLPTPDAMLVSAIRGSQADIVDYILTEFFITATSSSAFNPGGGPASGFPSHTSIPHYHHHNHNQTQNRRGGGGKAKSKGKGTKSLHSPTSTINTYYTAFPSPPSSSSSSSSSSRSVLPHSSASVYSATPAVPSAVTGPPPAAIPYLALWELLLFHPDLSVLEVLRQKCPEVISYEFAQERGHSFLHEALRRAGGATGFGICSGVEQIEGEGKGLRSLPHARLVHYLLDFGARVDTDLVEHSLPSTSKERKGGGKGDGTLLTALKAKQPMLVIEKCLARGCKVTVRAVEWCALRGDVGILSLLLRQWGNGGSKIKRTKTRGKEEKAQVKDKEEQQEGEVLGDDEEIMGVVWRCRCVGTTPGKNGQAILEAARMLEMYVGERRLRTLRRRRSGMGAKIMMMPMSGWGKMNFRGSWFLGGGAGEEGITRGSSNLEKRKEGMERIGTMKKKVLGRMRNSSGGDSVSPVHAIPQSGEGGDIVYTKPAPRVLRSKAPGFLELAEESEQESEELERQRKGKGKEKTVDTDQLERGLGLQDLRQGYDPVTLAYLTGEHYPPYSQHSSYRHRNRQRDTSSWLKDSHSDFSDCLSEEENGRGYDEEEYDDDDDDDDLDYHRRQRREMLRITRAKLLRAAARGSVSPLSLTR